MNKKTANTIKKPAKKWNVYFCGTGGQGVLTAAELCAIAAMNCGFHVKKSEVHGMAQRGGSVESHLRFGTRIYSPLIQPGEADLLVCFHEGEAIRTAAMLKKNGVSFLPFLKDHDRQPSNKKFSNTFYLGVLSAFLPLSIEAWLSAFSAKLKRNQGENELAFNEGRIVGLQHARGEH